MRNRILYNFILCLAFFCSYFLKDASIAQMEPQPIAVDYMVICAHPGDEYLFLGGVLPIYSGEQGRSAVVVYLSCQDDAQRQSAIDGLSQLGNKVQAIFGSFPYVYTSTKDEALKYWDKYEVTTYLENIIRQYNPTIIVTHDKMGEYGHGAHCLTTDCVMQAVRNCRANDSDLGNTIHLKRLFLHLYEDNQIALDRSITLSHLNNSTALEFDQQSYQRFYRTYPIRISDSAGYTRATYGLAYAIESDTFNPSTGDMFAGLDESLLSPTATPTISTTTTPNPILQITTSPLKTTTSVPTETTQRKELQTSFDINTLLYPTVLGMVFFIFAVIIWSENVESKFLLKQRSSVSKISLFSAFILGLTSIIVTSLIACSVYGVTGKTAEVPFTNTPIITYTPAPTYTICSTKESAPSPNPSDIYFRNTDDPPEIVIQDLENEHWEYRSDNLSIIIDRIHATRADGKPICYCIAHIRMREEDAFRAGLRESTVKGRTPGYEKPWVMARRFRAVLAITGDSLTHSETELKGILIRNGYVYSTNQAQDMLAFNPTDLNIKIYKPGTITSQELLDEGVENVYSFGPTLLNDGVRDLKSKRGNLGRSNPRCGIGMVEPGHFIAITVDGRQSNYSVGMSLDEFAQLFYLNGCTIAYNLDGGSSTVMIFMGEHLNRHSGEGSDVQRPLADALMWGYSELVPAVNDPIYNDGEAPLC